MATDHTIRAIVEQRTNNIEDNTAVAVLKSLTVVGHVPKEIAEVTGNEVNRGAGHGLEIPCTYHLYDPKAYCDGLKKILEEFTS